VISTDLLYSLFIARNRVHC